MKYDEDRIDEAVLALLHLTAFEDHGLVRAWRSHDWEAMERLHEKGFISDPRSKAKSVLLTEDGARRSAELCLRLFGRKG